MNVSQFRAEALQVLENVPREGLLITKRGKPLAKIVPADQDVVDNTKHFGILKGKMKIKGNIFSTGIKWDAER